MTLLFSSLFVSRAVSTSSTGISTGASSAPPVSFSTLKLFFVVCYLNKNSQRIFIFSIFLFLCCHYRLSDLISQVYLGQLCIILACHFAFIKSKPDLRIPSWTVSLGPWTIKTSYFESVLLGSISQVMIAPSNSSELVSLPKQAVNSANSPSDSIRVLQEDALKKIEEAPSKTGSVSSASLNQKLF